MGIESVNSFLSKEFIYILYVVLALILWFFYKSNVFKKLLRELSQHKSFFILSFIVAISVILTMNPFNALVYYDEPQYVESTRNLVENGNCLICSTGSELECEQSYLAPTGIGIFMIYSFFYASDYSLFSLKISVFNIAMHLLNSVILFAISQQLFKKSITPYICSLLVLFAPFGLIHSSSPTAIIFANTLFLLSIYGFILYYIGRHENRTNGISDTIYQKSASEEKKINELSELGFFVIFCLILLSTIRVEFILLLLLASLYFLFDCYKYFLRKNFRLILKKHKAKLVLFIFIGFIFSVLFIFFNWYQSAFFYTRANLTLFSLNDVIHYFTRTSFVVLNVFLIVPFFVVAMHYDKILKKNATKSLFVLLAMIFIFYVCFFSIKNTGQQFRYLIPITSIYVLISSAGIIYVCERFFGKGFVSKSVITIIVVLVCLNFVIYAYSEKKNILNVRLCEIWLFDYLLSNEFKELSLDLSKQNSYFFATTPFLFEINDIKNYTGDFDIAFKQLAKGNNVYYLRNYFRTEFDDDSRFILDYFESSMPMCPYYGLAKVSRVQKQ